MDEATIDALIQDRKGRAPRSVETDPDKAIRERHPQYEELTDDHLAEAADGLFI